MRRKKLTKFVKRMNELNSRIVYRILWNSQERGTYIRAKHGELL